MTFNVRVYGILINEKQEILLSDLLFYGKQFTKFCGGGLEFGEGTKDCLIREFKEELGIEIEVGEHIYTTDFFQRSAFNPNQQIISIYYFVKPKNGALIKTVDHPFCFDDIEKVHFENENEQEVFRFVSLKEFNEDQLTFPIDKIVAHIIKSKFDERNLA